MKDMNEEKRALTEEEIEKKISDLVAIWGIEGMEFTQEELDRKRAYLRGEITKEEFMSDVLERPDAETETKNKN